MEKSSKSHFQPHSLGSTIYASLRHIDKCIWQGTDMKANKTDLYWRGSENIILAVTISSEMNHKAIYDLSASHPKKVFTNTICPDVLKYPLDDEDAYAITSRPIYQSIVKGDPYVHPNNQEKFTTKHLTHITTLQHAPSHHVH